MYRDDRLQIAMPIATKLACRIIIYSQYGVNAAGNSVNGCIVRYPANTDIYCMKRIHPINFLNQIKAYGVNCCFSYIRNPRLFFSTSEVPKPVWSGFSAAVELLQKNKSAESDQTPQ